MFGPGPFTNERRAHRLAAGRRVDEGALLNLLLTEPWMSDEQLNTLLDIAEAHGFNYAVWVMKTSIKRHGARR